MTANFAKTLIKELQPVIYKNEYQMAIEKLKPVVKQLLGDTVKSAEITALFMMLDAMLIEFCSNSIFVILLMSVASAISLMFFTSKNLMFLIVFGNLKHNFKKKMLLKNTSE